MHLSPYIFIYFLLNLFIPGSVQAQLLNVACTGLKWKKKVISLGKCIKGQETKMPHPIVRGVVFSLMLFVFSNLIWTVKRLCKL